MRIEVNNITLHYTKEGSGTPLLLLHGNGEDLSIFSELIAKLKKHYCVYAIDSRNHGESSMTDDNSYESMAKDILCFIEKLKLKNVSILGFSDGAITALLMEIAQPNIFSKMVLLGVNLQPTDFKEEIYNELVESYKQSQDPFLAMMLEQPNILLSQLEIIETPSLVIAAENEIFKEEIYEAIVATMPNATLKIMTGHDHGSYIVNQDILYPYLIEFL